MRTCLQEVPPMTINKYNQTPFMEYKYKDQVNDLDPSWTAIYDTLSCNKEVFMVPGDLYVVKGSWSEPNVHGASFWQGLCVAICHEPANGRRAITKPMMFLGSSVLRIYKGDKKTYESLQHVFMTSLKGQQVFISISDSSMRGNGSAVLEKVSV